ncbi:ATPase family gene 2 protein homolog A [Musca vetustissima]|uniref:ATPase family gene 2 protein homolog A n=1 Tax=Musca vetustissima TaxID=27455 RepID=UPI002AB5E80E|nr:ATPase family gene 2 protein homolog A [Musca vetustissima]
MPPKSSNKKSSNKAAAIWYNCEKCDAHITANDREKHENVCPIEDGQIENEKGEPLEYIRRGIFSTSSLEVRKFEIEPLKDMPEKYINNLIFISEGVIRLSGLHIGQQVLIKSAKEDVVRIRNVWPIPDKFLTTIFVNENDFKNNWCNFKGHNWQIQCLPKGQPITAKNLLLEIEKESSENGGETNIDLNDQQLQDLERLLKHELKNLCFAKDTIIHYNFFNKQLKFKVIGGTNITEAKSNELEIDFKKLSLNTIGDIFRVTNTTEVKISKDESKQLESAEDTNYSISKEDIGGLQPQLNIIEEAIDFALGIREIPKGVKISRGLLIYGSSGCGKTMICEAMSTKLLEQQRRQTKSAFKPLILHLNTSELFSKFLGETEKNLNLQFDKVFQHYPQPSLVIIEDVHNLCPKQETNDVVKRVAIAFFSLLDSLSHKKEAQRCFVLATTSNIEMLNPSIRRCGRLDCEVEVAAPTPDGRKEILHCLLKKVENHKLQEEDIKEIAQITHGFVGADLANLIYNATLKAMKNASAPLSGGNVELGMADINSALMIVKPSAMREVLIECPNVRWSDIGGQDELKLKLQQAIEWPLKHAEQFQRLGIKPPRGILMYGPPGCSKTMIAKALATESQLNFLSIKGPELFSMWVGESERAVREVFRKARQVAPSIVFFDEIDAIGGERAEGASGGSGSSVKERVLTQLLTEMDGVESLQNVTIVAATNRPDMIDKALLRPGRIDRIIYVGLPNSEARRQIFTIKLKKMPLADDVCVDVLVERTDGYSGAEIQAVCHEAALKTLEESFDATAVTMTQFEYALSVVRPRTSSDLLRLYEEYQKKT